MSLAFMRFFESLPSALAVGLLLLPMLIGEDSRRFKPVVAALGAFRALLGFGFLAMTARAIIPAERPIDLDALVAFTGGTAVGKAWAVTQVLAILFAALAAARMFVDSSLLDRATLGVGVAVIAVVSLTGHAIDDTFALYQQASFLFHTAAGLTWLGGLLGLVWWMATARGKPPEVASRLAERWSMVAKVAMVIVLISGLVMAWENVGSFANLFATPYGRLLTLKLIFLCFVLLAALMLVRYNLRVDATANFDTAWYTRIGTFESVFGVGLLFLAGWIAVITPASHETDLYWPFPFRLSWAATWGFVGSKLPWIDTPGWYLAPAWSGVFAAIFAAVAAGIWWLPAGRGWRLWGAPTALALAAAGVISSFTTIAYTDTYADPAVDYTAESVARGMTTFADNCVSCHGPQGEGNGPLAKDLKDEKGLAVAPADLTAPHAGNHTSGDIFHWLSFGGTSGVMPGFKDQLQADDRWDLINYLLILSYANRSRFLGPQGQIQWLIAPDFALLDPDDVLTTLYKLRGKATLVSFARCAGLSGDAAKDVTTSLETISAAMKTIDAHHVTVYDKACPANARGREASHPKAAEITFSVINRYPNEPISLEIPEGHFLVDKSGYVRARFRRFATDDGAVAKLKALVDAHAKEPFVVINLHSH